MKLDTLREIVALEGDALSQYVAQKLGWHIEKRTIKLRNYHRTKDMWIIRLEHTLPLLIDPQGDCWPRVWDEENQDFEVYELAEVAHDMDDNGDVVHFSERELWEKFCPAFACDIALSLPLDDAEFISIEWTSNRLIAYWRLHDPTQAILVDPVYKGQITTYLSDSVASLRCKAWLMIQHANWLLQTQSEKSNI